MYPFSQDHAWMENLAEHLAGLKCELTSTLPRFAEQSPSPWARHTGDEKRYRTSSPVPSAIAAAEKALDLESQDSTVLGLVGCALADAGQVERALPILHKSIEAGPGNGHAKTALGGALMMKQDYKAAANLLAEGMACSPADNRLSVWGTALALAELALGELDNALESATNACREDDRLYLPRLALAGVHLVREEQTEAVAAVQETLRTKPNLDQQEITCVLGERLGGGVWTIAQSILGHKASSKQTFTTQS